MAFPRNDGPAPQCLIHLLSPLYPPSTRAAAHNTAVDMTCQLCYNGGDNKKRALFSNMATSKTAQVNKCKFDLCIDYVLRLVMYCEFSFRVLHSRLPLLPVVLP